MEALHQAVAAKGLIFLNESGLDPGIDIMSTMKVVHEAQEAGLKVVGYESWCGGLPIAE
jgi:saccharopine dehydrogenase-like NADP-dependent oxidoreductase